MERPLYQSPHLFTRPPTLRDKICCSVTNNIKVKDSSSLCASMSQNNVSWLRTIGNVYSLVLIWQYETRATSTNWKIVVLSIYWKWETWKFYLFSKLSHNLPTLRLFVLLHTWQLTNKKKRCKNVILQAFKRASSIDLLAKDAPNSKFGSSRIF